MHHPDAVSHARFIHAVLGGEAPAQNAVCSRIQRSWHRCVREHGLDPTRKHEPERLERQALAACRASVEPLLDIAKVEMTNLHEQVADSGFAILLTDAKGVILELIGDPKFTGASTYHGLSPGAIWSEAAQGTNGMGTCLVERQPLVVHHTDHFFPTNTALTCSAAPIFTPGGELLAVLDASSESTLRQQHTMALVNMAAQTIEDRLFLRQYNDWLLVRFHSRPELVASPGEGVVAFDGQGKLAGANRSALFQLSCDTREPLVGRAIEDIFDVTLARLTCLAAEQPLHPVAIRDARSGGRYFATLQIPGGSLNGTRHKVTSLNTRAPAEEALEPCFRELELGDPAMARTVQRARRVIGRDLPIILYGETGTGKGLFAKAIHLAGQRSDKPFVAVNCAAIPDTLIESELFGYKSGAFTGARREGSRGKIVQAHGGTLFLDEIGDMPPQLQARLLRVLEDNEVVPLGSETPIEVDIQIVSATHQDLKQLIGDGVFREDLYYRLQGVALSLPPLRERQDRRALIEHLARLETYDEGPPVTLGSELMQRLEDYPWPGNIRQLRHTLRAMLALRQGDLLTLADLPDELQGQCSRAAEDTDGERCDTTASPSPLASAEREAILGELEAVRWNVTKAARKLGVSRNTLYRKMRRYGIQPPR